MTHKGWVKTYSENYEDCIVGNKDGLQALKNAIDEAIENEGTDIDKFCKADFRAVVKTDKEWSESESNDLPMWQQRIFITLFLLWLIVLPIIGVISVINYIWA